jgi:hypothetical protein
VHVRETGQAASFAIRGTGGLLRAAFPTCAGFGLLIFFRCVETLFIQDNPCVSAPMVTTKARAVIGRVLIVRPEP